MIGLSREARRRFVGDDDVAPRTRDAFAPAPVERVVAESKGELD